jgi:hypothetical protein
MHIYASWPTTGQVGTRDSETPTRRGTLAPCTYPPVGLSAAPVAHTGGGMQNGPVWRGEMRMVLTRILTYCLSKAVTIAVIGESLFTMNLASWPLERRSFAAVGGNELGTGSVVRGWS